MYINIFNHDRHKFISITTDGIVVWTEMNGDSEWAEWAEYLLQNGNFLQNYTTYSNKIYIFGKPMKFSFRLTRFNLSSLVYDISDFDCHMHGLDVSSATKSRSKVKLKVTN